MPFAQMLMFPGFFSNVGYHRLSPGDSFISSSVILAIVKQIYPGKLRLVCALGVPLVSHVRLLQENGVFFLPFTRQQFIAHAEASLVTYYMGICCALALSKIK